MAADGAGVGKTWVVGQIGAAQGATDGSDVAGRLQAGEEEPPPVGGAVGVHERGLVAFPRFGPGHLAQRHLEPEVPAEDVGARAQQGHLDHPAPPRGPLFEHGGQEAGQRRQTGDVVTDPTARVQRRALVVGHLHRKTRPRPERTDVIGRSVPLVAPQAVPADAAVDETGVAGHRRGRLQAETIERVGPEIADEDIRRRQQVLQMLFVLGPAQVQHDAAFAPIVEGEGRVRHIAVDPQRAEHVAHGVAGGRLDLYDIGAPVGQEGCRGGRGHPDAQFDDPQARQRRKARLGIVAHRFTDEWSCAARCP